jgi:uncharacterized CHY-type Zn-finger protein
MTDNEKELMPCPLYCGWCGKKTEYNDYFHECNICQTCNKKFINSVKNTRPQQSNEVRECKPSADVSGVIEDLDWLFINFIQNSNPPSVAIGKFNRVRQALVHKEYSDKNMGEQSELPKAVDVEGIKGEIREYFFGIKIGLDFGWGDVVDYIASQGYLNTNERVQELEGFIACVSCGKNSDTSTPDDADMCHKCFGEFNANAYDELQSQLNVTIEALKKL